MQRSFLVPVVALVLLAVAAPVWAAGPGDPVAPSAAVAAEWAKEAARHGPSSKASNALYGGYGVLHRRPDVMKRTWLGNVRELRNVLERASLLAEGKCWRSATFRQPCLRARDELVRHATDLPSSSRTLTEDKGLVERTISYGCLKKSAGTTRRRLNAWA